eukprot:TRINITY_DN1489_c1_g1_i1.p1 TRINITY_DN1489_c1_g1~~TRINITY_DN1489_c1_g1_i1.p1  ORF type:complete len:706 (+),score=244.78 TRINITY_DN1489_c1_g1_i1:57-2120(+)
MKLIATTTAVALVAPRAVAETASTSPVAKILDMLSDLHSKVSAEGEESKKAFAEFSECCEGRSKELKFDVKTGKAQAEELEATIAKAAADIEAANAKVEELTSSISSSEKELKDAVAMRKKEASDFAEVEKELIDTIDSIQRASSILEREMAKGGSFAQLGGAKDLTQALTALVDASVVSSGDASKLTALLQATSGDEDSAEVLGAPSSAVYESKSSSITEALNGLQEKAEEQLADARKAETNSLHNFDLKKQGLDDEIKYANKDLAETKQALAKSSETKATAEGDLSTTTSDVAEDSKTLKDLEADCMSKAQEYEEQTASRNEELKALTEAKKVIAEATGGATDQTYALGQVSPSLLQVSAHSRALSPGLSAVHIVRNLARDQHSSSLAQLAGHMESFIMRGGVRDPFAKVKDLVQNMITKLEDEAGADAEHKAFCDKEMAETGEKKADSTTLDEKMTSKLDQMSSATAKLKEEVSLLRKELSDLASAQAEMDKLRQEEKARFEKNKPELEQGIDGVKKAIQILKDYYSKGDDGASSGAAGGIISLLEVAESDFSKGLAEMVAVEEKAAADYEKETKDNKLTEVTKDKDVEHKSREITSLEKASGELRSDRDGVLEQLAAVDEQLAELKKQCVAKPESYEERAQRRVAEIDGLKAALDALDEDVAPAFLQRRRQRVSARVAALRAA